MSVIKSFAQLNIQTRNYVSAHALHPKKFTSILENVPIKPRNSWQIFFRENIQNNKGANGKIDVKLATKALSAQWKALDENQKQAYQHKFDQESKAHLDAYNDAINNATSDQIRKENELRKKYKLPLLKDPRQPKRPKNAFLFYIEHLRAINDPAIAGKDITEQVSEAAKKYKQLSPSEAKIYKDKSVAATEQYRKDCEKHT
ncbi:MAG: hypothetical protein EXX96DRAFT_570221 [Benjaminiella poitrasii]|nr:MAG: hypothetical protein EXX96DRAFT_570221 [Benjaminiella poitrasii]